MNLTFGYTHVTLPRSMRLPGSQALIHQDTGTTHLLQKLGTLKYLGQLRPNWWQKLALWTSSSLEDSAAVLHSLVRYKTQFFELPVRNEGSGAKIDVWFWRGGGEWEISEIPATSTTQCWSGTFNPMWRSNPAFSQTFQDFLFHDAIGLSWLLVIVQCRSN